MQFVTHPICILPLLEVSDYIISLRVRLSGASGNVGISPTALLLSDSLYTFHSLIHPQAAENDTLNISEVSILIQFM